MRIDDGGDETCLISARSRHRSKLIRVLLKHNMIANMHIPSEFHAPSSRQADGVTGKLFVSY